MRISDWSSDVCSSRSPERTGARIAGAGIVQGAAVERLGRAGAVGRAEGICGVGRAIPACVEGGTGQAAGARGADGTGAGLFRFTAAPGGAGPGGKNGRES